MGRICLVFLLCSALSSVNAVAANSNSRAKGNKPNTPDIPRQLYAPKGMVWKDGVLVKKPWPARWRATTRRYTDNISVLPKTAAVGAFNTVLACIGNASIREFRPEEEAICAEIEPSVYIGMGECLSRDLVFIACFTRLLRSSVDTRLNDTWYCLKPPDQGPYGYFSNERVTVRIYADYTEYNFLESLYPIQNGVLSYKVDNGEYTAVGRFSCDAGYCTGKAQATDDLINSFRDAKKAYFNYGRGTFSLNLTGFRAPNDTCTDACEQASDCGLPGG